MSESKVGWVCVTGLKSEMKSQEEPCCVSLGQITENNVRVYCVCL